MRLGGAPRAGAERHVVCGERLARRGERFGVLAVAGQRLGEVLVDEAERVVVVGPRARIREPAELRPPRRRSGRGGSARSRGSCAGREARRRRPDARFASTRHRVAKRSARRRRADRAARYAPATRARSMRGVHADRDPRPRRRRAARCSSSDAASANRPARARMRPPDVRSLIVRGMLRAELRCDRTRARSSLSFVASSIAIEAAERGDLGATIEVDVVARRRARGGSPRRACSDRTRPRSFFASWFARPSPRSIDGIELAIAAGAHDRGVREARLAFGRHDIAVRTDDLDEQRRDPGRAQVGVRRRRDRERIVERLPRPADRPARAGSCRARAPPRRSPAAGRRPSRRRARPRRRCAPRAACRGGEASPLGSRAESLRATAARIRGIGRGELAAAARRRIRRARGRSPARAGSVPGSGSWRARRANATSWTRTCSRQAAARASSSPSSHARRSSVASSRRTASSASAVAAAASSAYASWVPVNRRDELVAHLRVPHAGERMRVSQLAALPRSRVSANVTTIVGRDDRDAGGPDEPATGGPAAARRARRSAARDPGYRSAGLVDRPRAIAAHGASIVCGGQPLADASGRRPVSASASDTHRLN